MKFEENYFLKEAARLLSYYLKRAGSTERIHWDRDSYAEVRFIVESIAVGVIEELKTELEWELIKKWSGVELRHKIGNEELNELLLIPGEEILE